MPNNNKNADRKWYLIDASKGSLGRIATGVADLLRGKKKPDFTPNRDRGDYVVVINAKNFILSGNKENAKKYYSHRYRK